MDVESVGFVSADGVKLFGEIRRRGVAWVILVHDRRRDLDAWSSVSAVLAAEGYSVLAVDLRGCGMSGGNPAVANSSRDVVAAVEVARAQGALEIFAIGAGSGCDPLVRACSDADFAGIVLASPSSSWSRPSLRRALRSSTTSKLVLVGSLEQGALGAADELMQNAIGPRVVVRLPTMAQSHELFESGSAPQAFDATLTFLAHHRRDLVPGTTPSTRDPETT